MSQTRMTELSQISLTSEWFVRPGKEHEVISAVAEVAEQVRLHEPRTLTYLVHTNVADCDSLQSIPPPMASSILFYEMYENAEAFKAHLDGPIFTAFLKRCGDLFICKGEKPFCTVRFMNRRAGFVRAAGDRDAVDNTMLVSTPNLHPSVMFEIIAKDQRVLKQFYTAVFGWNYQIGTDNFSYIHFPGGVPPLIGGIGQAKAEIVGSGPGTNFYLLVKSLQPMLDKVLMSGGTILMDPVEVDGYRFAMFKDPEENAVGLIEPF